MKNLFENWKRFINEDEGKVYYWQTRGPWRAESTIEFGVTHVPQADPRDREGGLIEIEELFEEVRKERYDYRPSRLNCVFLCENLEGYSGRSFCSYPVKGDNETYEIELRGQYKIFKTNSEYWTEAVIGYDRSKDEGRVRGWAEAYWEGDVGPGTMVEVLVSPPEAAIIVRKYGNETTS